jgi:flagellar assembly factor FliW
MDELMILSTTRFGDIEIPDDKIITMPKPVLGFEQLRRYCIIEREDCEPFLWYQSVDDANVAFMIVNPLVFCPDYRIEVNPRELDELKIADVGTVETYAIVTIPKNPADISINLQGPILINTANRLAKQLVLVNSNYRIKHRLADMIEIPVEETIVEEVLEEVAV